MGLGEYSEESTISYRATGSHTRMIIDNKDKNERLIFLDSWGAGHEIKRMNLTDAYSATRGLFAILPTVH